MAIGGGCRAVVRWRLSGLDCVLKPTNVVISPQVFGVPMISPSIHHSLGEPIVGRLANNRACLVEGCDAVQGFDAPMKCCVGGLWACVGVQQRHEARRTTRESIIESAFIDW